MDGGKRVTFLEKALELEYENNSTEVSVYEIMKNYCPSEYGFSEDTKCGKEGETTEGDCVKCWNRESSGVEPSCDDVKAAYDQGMLDAWELAKKCVHLEGCGEDNELMYKIFNTVFIKQLFDDNTPQEALAKLKAYEEAQSKVVVGDVVKDNYNDTAVVLDETESYYSVFTRGGCVQEWSKDICKKTGKHLDISSILEQIGE